MKSIFIAIPSTRDDKRFIDSLFELVNQCEGKYQIDTAVIKNKYLFEAQNELTDIFLGGKSEYILFLDDDHFGHTIEMLDTLVNANTMIATMKTYSRHYPYSCSLMKLVSYTNGALRYAGIEDGEGYRTCDLTGFPMTLIKRELFNLIGQPYFRVEEDSGGRAWATDKEFFERIAMRGIKPIGCFQHCLGHDKVSQENVAELREKEIKENNNEGSYQFLKMNMIVSNKGEK